MCITSNYDWSKGDQDSETGADEEFQAETWNIDHLQGNV